MFGLGGQFQTASEGNVHAFAAEEDFVVQIQVDVHAERNGIAGFFFRLAQYHNVVVQFGHAGFLEAEVAFVHFQHAVKDDTVFIAITKMGIAAGGQAAAGFVEDAVFVENGIHVHCRHAAAPADGARQVDVAVAALEEQRLYLPLLAVEAGTQAAVVQNHAQVAVDVV